MKRYSAYIKSVVELNKKDEADKDDEERCLSIRITEDQDRTKERHFLTDSPIGEVFIDFSDRQLTKLQETDDECLRIAELINNVVFMSRDIKSLQKDPLYNYARRCTVIGGVLVTLTSNGDEMYVPVVPREMRQDIMQVAHVGHMGHMKGERLIQLILQ